MKIAAVALPWITYSRPYAARYGQPMRTAMSIDTAGLRARRRLPSMASAIIMPGSSSWTAR
ncbi:hypothetical protein XarjCFBP8253_00060 [Xanthomonas arboricola pv. juglandis]|uniref:Uncharacterized protein n=1 Tax=Xanthomonas arboricola pv. populi TaxID=487823 RepID=A0A2S6Z4Y7_9XANT|nr:hypothetical protein XaplCFBP3122_09715 [Xanthomonas arboricola pv. populi]PPU04089.1 hypothetical protein XarjCFBP8253_00060 [Xanthomonas arboricola pv. juglandis]